MTIDAMPTLSTASRVWKEANRPTRPLLRLEALVVNDFALSGLAVAA